MRAEPETHIARARADVFDYISNGQRLPEYVSDFASVRQRSTGAAGPGTEYAYKLERGAEGTFRWSEFERPSRLAWEGPAVKAGPGSTMAPAGYWELHEEGHSTRVKLAMTPRAGGLFKLLGPLMSLRTRRENAQALSRLKARLEGTTPTT